MKLASFVLGSIALIIQYYATKFQHDDFSKTLEDLGPDLSLPRIDTFDFIVVGGGTAGSLIAGKLSEHYTVLLLEIGGSPIPSAFNPFLNPFVAGNPAVNNLFISQKQFNFAQENGGIVVSHTGKMLGGSGSHNGNFFNRGSPHDYNNYAAITGDDSWNYSNVLNNFKSFENFNGRLVQEDQRYEYYSTAGQLHVETDWPPIIDGWLKSGEELGFNAVDPNGYQSEGFAPVVKSIKDGERVNTYSTFVKPIENLRSTLKVLRYSHVLNVLIDESSRAYGVAYLRHGIPQIAHAAKEVIVSCGTFQSPMLLIRSGIGPKTILEEAQIPIKQVSEGVGKNFRDHAAVVLQFTVTSPNTTLFPIVPESEIEEELNKYQNSPRSGYFTRMDVGPQAIIVSSRAKLDGQGEWPDIQIVLLQQPILGSEIQKLILQVVVNRGKSVGEIGFNSAAYLNGEIRDTELALVDFKLFSEFSDSDVMIEAIKLALSIMENTTTFQNMKVDYTGTSPEACKSITFRTDEYWKCYIKQRAVSWLHAAGTCKMGMNDDTEAVVDSKLRVRGVQNLRVVDASVLPRPTNVNINAAVMLVAEKTYREILNENLSSTI